MIVFTNLYKAGVLFWGHRQTALDETRQNAASQNAASHLGLN